MNSGIKNERRYRNMYDVFEETKKNLSDRSQFYLFKKNMSILELSKKIGKAYSTAHRLVNNGNKLFVSRESIEMLAKAFDVPYEMMITPLSEEELSEMNENQKKI